MKEKEREDGRKGKEEERQGKENEIDILNRCARALEKKEKS